MLDLWIPHVDPDVIWIVGPDEIQPDAEREREVVPFVALSAADVAAVAAEENEEEILVLIVFCAADLLEQAASLGLPREPITIGHHVPDGAERRIAAEFSIDDDSLAAFRAVESLGFSLEIQPLPNVTARPWSASEHD